MQFKGKLWSRCGVAALSIPMALGMSGTALAAPAPLYDNLAQTGSQTNGVTSYDVEYQLSQSTAASFTADNEADAAANNCHDCGAVAIGFQVLVVSNANLNTITANNTSEAISSACTRCGVLAGAYQIVVATHTPQKLSLAQILGLADIHAKLLTIQRDDLSLPRAEQLADGLADEAAALLQGHAGTNQQAGPYTPAMNSADLPGHLAMTAGPVVNLYETIKH